MEIIIITLIILPKFFSAGDDIISTDGIFGNTAGSSFSFFEHVGPNYPKSIALKCRLGTTYILGFTYGNNYIYAGSDIDIEEKKITFQDNEFVNTIELGKRMGILIYIKIITNKNNYIGCGVTMQDVEFKVFNNNGYAIAGFYGTINPIINSLGIIYHKFYYNCPKLESEQFCSYDHTEILTTMQMVFF